MSIELCAGYLSIFAPSISGGATSCTGCTVRTAPEARLRRGLLALSDAIS